MKPNEYLEPSVCPDVCACVRHGSESAFESSESRGDFIARVGGGIECLCRMVHLVPESKSSTAKGQGLVGLALVAGALPVRSSSGVSIRCLEAEEDRERCARQITRPELRERQRSPVNSEFRHLT